MFSVAVLPAIAQIQYGGKPDFGALNAKVVPEIVIPSPDLEELLLEDSINEAEKVPPRFGVWIPAEIDPLEQGRWVDDENGTSIWMVRLKAEGALAISPAFRNFYMMPGDSLFIVWGEKNRFIGAYTSGNNTSSGLFGTELIPSDDIILQLKRQKSSNAAPPFQVSELLYAYRMVPEALRAPGSSDWCEVNINCSPEGDDWQNQKRGVARIQVKVGGSAYWCTGSLVNNVRQDKTPYLLTADHCAYQLGHYASDDDLALWTFYFNYEALQCEGTLPAPGHHTMVGAEKIAQGGNRGSTGSDFYLVRLLFSFPEGYPVYYNGWDAQGVSSGHGVTIHHPDGDIKKVSTYIEPLVTTSWQGSGLPSHWEVTWSETENGWGVTEGGSSGSPVFNEQGLITGTLTGGLAACDNFGSTGPDKPDYYGKFSWHWDQNGTADTAQLKPWLDPDNTGIKQLSGLVAGTKNHFSSNSGSLQLFPCPASDESIFIHHNFVPGKSLKMEVYSFSVVKMYDYIFPRAKKTVSVSVSGWSSGIYFILLHQAGKTEAGKIIIK
ncbi:MAG: T9SS type A sorting domain-containing protein [Bacteroidales bacterium]